MPKGFYPTNRGRTPWNKGLKGVQIPSEETKKKMSIAHKGKNTWSKGRKISIEHNLKKYRFPKKENNPSWKHGKSKDEKYRSWIKNKRNRTKRELNKTGDFHTFFDWENLKAQYNWTCPCCKRKEPEIKLTEDHIIPLSRGGSDNIENIQPLCKSCNCKKHAKIIKY